MEEKNKMLPRTDEIDRFIKILTKKDKVSYETESFNVALNGRWGDGKTTFLNQLKEAVRSDGNKNIELKNIFTINAWDYDFLDDPSEMFYHFLENNESMKEGEKNQFLSKIFNVLEECATKYITSKFNLLKIIKDVLKSQQIEESSKQKQLLSILELKKRIKENCYDLNDEIYIFIDDLDRCNPNFVIKLIELTKHIFDIRNITIIYMMDWENTNTSIMNHYGLEIKNDDNEKYLSKIIDYKWDLPHLQKEEYLYQKYFKNTLIWRNDVFFLQYKKHIKNASFREAEKVTIKYKICVLNFSKAYNTYENYIQNNSLKLFQIILDVCLYALVNSKKSSVPNIDANNEEWQEILKIINYFLADFKNHYKSTNREEIIKEILKITREMTN